MEATSEQTTSNQGWVFLRAIQASTRRALLWFACACLLVLLAGALAIPTHTWMEASIGSRYAPGDATSALDTIFRTDHSAGLANVARGTASSAGVLQIVVLLLGIFAAGGWLQVLLERASGYAMRRFLSGGCRFFLRFLRVAILVLALLACAQWVLYGMPWKKLVLEGALGLASHDLARMEGLESELMMRRLGWIQDGCMTLSFALILAWALYTRTRLALHDSRSVIWAGACSALTILRHPIRTLRPLLLLFVAEASVLVFLAGWATDFFEQRLGASPSAWWILGLAMTGFTALAWREVLRGARYHAVIAVSAVVVKSTSQPDPWNVIGGPGGPQYPMDDDLDERYGVAL